MEEGAWEGHRYEELLGVARSGMLLLRDGFDRLISERTKAQVACCQVLARGWEPIALKLSIVDQAATAPLVSHFGVPNL